MRTRICLLLLLVLPTLAFWPVLVGEYAAPADLEHLQARSESSTLANIAETPPSDPWRSAFVEVSFSLLARDTVPGLALVRLMTVLVLVLCGVALWIGFDRGGWQEVDAAVAAVAILLLPAGQLVAGWAALWPSLTASLLSVAAVAALEGEVEMGGHRRWIGAAGALALHFAAALCYLPNATLGLALITGLALVKPAKDWERLRNWFFLHLVLMAAGLIAAQFFSPWPTAGAAGVAERLLGFFTGILPGSWMLFAAGAGWLSKVIGGLLGLAAFSTIWLAARKEADVDALAVNKWWLALVAPLSFAGVVLLVSPEWHAGPRAYWTLGAILVAAWVAALRVLLVQVIRKQLKLRLAFAALLLVAVVLAGSQVGNKIVAPLASDWREMLGRVGDLKISSHTQVYLQSAPGAPAKDPDFNATLTSRPEWMKRIFTAALHERFPSGLPKGWSVTVEADTVPPAPDFSGVTWQLKPVSP